MSDNLVECQMRAEPQSKVGKISQSFSSGLTLAKWVKQSVKVKTSLYTIWCLTVMILALSSVGSSTLGLNRLTSSALRVSGTVVTEPDMVPGETAPCIRLSWQIWVKALAIMMAMACLSTSERWFVSGGIVVGLPMGMDVLPGEEVLS